MTQRRRLTLGIVLLLGPLAGAMLTLFVGLSTEQLSLVYLSIGLSMVALPATAAGVVLIVLSRSSGSRRE